MPAGKTKTFIDINCDMGESFGAYRIGSDEEVINHITSANIACGFHASDPNVMESTVNLCKKHRVMAGAHPGYRDLIGFGRRFIDMSPHDLINEVIYQVGALKAFLDMNGLPLQHIKLHGALYNHLVNDEELFVNMASSLRRAFGDTIFLTLGTKRTANLKRRCRKKGIKLALEAFPDRAYTDDGELLPRKLQDAVIKDPDAIAQRAADMVMNKGIMSANGKWIDMEIETLCIHGDNPESIEAARTIHDLLKSRKITVLPLSEFM